MLLAACAASAMLCACAKRTEPVDVVEVQSLTAPDASDNVSANDGAEDGEDIIYITPPPATPEPAPTPEPTPALPELVQCEPVKGYTDKSGVNLREQPSTDSDILDTLDKAVELTITGEAGTWFCVELNDETGYISQEFVGKGDVPAVLTINNLSRKNGVTNAGGVNLRKGPSTKGYVPLAAVILIITNA